MTASKLLLMQLGKMLKIYSDGLVSLSWGFTTTPLINAVERSHVLEINPKFIKKTAIFFTDIEECQTETDNCHVDANCTNTNGSFNCTCLAGYSGDGVTCDGK